MDLDTHTSGIIDNLIAAGLGVLIGLLWRRIVSLVTIRALRWFWAPKSAPKCFLYIGERSGLLAHEGEIEPLVHLADAKSALDIKSLLQHYYDEVIVVTAEDQIEWSFPVVSIGGPVSNLISRKAIEKGWLPVDFLDAPYAAGAKRRIGSKDKTEVYSPSFDEAGKLASDIGYFARIKSPLSDGQYIYLVAGNYGAGTYGTVQHALSPSAMLRIRFSAKSQYFQQIVKVHISGDRATKSETVTIKAM